MESVRSAASYLSKGELRMAAVELCPTPLFIRIYNRKADAKLSRETNGSYRLQTDEGDWSLPNAKDSIRITHVANGLNPPGYKRLLDKYQYDGFVELTRDDRVVDVGAYIGEFSRAVRHASDATVAAAIEPDPENARFVEENTNVDTLQLAVWNVSKEISFNRASHGSESSLLAVDRGDSERVTVSARTLDEILADVEKITFLKVEAEGAEPEVLEGLKEYRPAKVAVDCGPERDGEATVAECFKWLETYGYETRVKRNVVFGRIPAE